MFKSLFFDPERYDLSAVGRVKMNMRLDLDAEDTVRMLRKEDIIAVIRTLVDLRDGRGEIDDIDNLGNRRVRSVGELMENQYRVGLLRMERAIKERMSSVEIDTVMPQDLINAKPAAAAVREFFGSSQLSQFMDQTNPLSEITHKRRLSALGPGGLTRERAGFEVRDVHPTHYGRICPIETPEGPNIGLINSLATFARVNKYGFIESPYRKIVNGHVSDEVVYLSAMEEAKYTVAQANARLDGKGRFVNDLVTCRHAGDVAMFPREKVDLMDVSPKQLVSVAAALIPFLENDDANRALMGSNMQRQAVPLVRAEAPLVGTGMEPIVARDSGAAIAARRTGVIDQVDATRIVVRATEERDASRSGVDIYRLQKFQRSNQSTCITQRPLVSVGDRVRRGRDHRRRPVDGPRRPGARAQRARRLHAVERLQLRGLDPALRADRPRRRVHVHPHRGIRGDGARHQARPGGDHARHSERVGRGAEEPRRGGHRLCRRRGEAGRHPGRQDHAEGREPDDAGGEAAPRHLRREGVRRARHVAAGCRRGPSARWSRCASSTATAWRRTSAPWRSSARRSSGSPRTATTSSRSSTATSTAASREMLRGQVATSGPKGFKKGTEIDDEVLDEHPRSQWWQFATADDALMTEIEALRAQYDESRKRLESRFIDKVEKLQRGDELPPGVMKMVKVFVAVKRKIQPGDKMAGRHGNKGVVSKIVPIEDMPFLEDGTHVDIVLNPLGVPSRMNVGQILETHLGWACAGLGMKVGKLVEDYRKSGDTKPLRGHAAPSSTATTPRTSRSPTSTTIRWCGSASSFAAACRSPRRCSTAPRRRTSSSCWRRRALTTSGQSRLYDGRTGEAFDREVTVGYIYMLKLHHLVDDKIHARSIGPYSLVTQQPLGGKAQFGGQRFGEMEVWALEAYGAAYTLQEMLTVKSDDVAGRTKVYEAIVRGDDTFEAGIPESFNVLVKEMRSLGLNVELQDTEVRPQIADRIQPTGRRRVGGAPRRQFLEISAANLARRGAPRPSGGHARRPRSDHEPRGHEHL